MVVYCVQRVEQDRYQKQVPYTLNKWVMGLIPNNRSLFQEWFEVRISHLNHAATVYILQECLSSKFLKLFACLIFKTWYYPILFNLPYISTDISY